MNKNYLWIAGIIALILIVSQTKKEASLDGDILSCTGAPSTAQYGDYISVNCQIKNTGSLNNFVFDLVDQDDRLSTSYYEGISSNQVFSANGAFVMPDKSITLYARIYTQGPTLNDELQFTITKNGQTNEVLRYINGFMAGTSLDRLINNLNSWINPSLRSPFMFMSFDQSFSTNAGGGYAHFYTTTGTETGNFMLGTRSYNDYYTPFTEQQKLKIVLDSNSYVNQGSSLETYSSPSGVVYIYIPQKQAGAEMVLYPDTNGNTYYDTGLTQLAQAAP